MAERLGPEIVGFQPQDHEILAALVLFSPRGIPQEQVRFAQGLKAACESAPFLSRFIDGETGDLSDTARQSLTTLQEGVLASQDDVFIVGEEQTKQITACTKMYFKPKGIDSLKEAAAAAQQVWFPAQ